MKPEHPFTESPIESSAYTSETKKLSHSRSNKTNPLGTSGAATETANANIYISLESKYQDSSDHNTAQRYTAPFEEPPKTEQTLHSYMNK